MGLFTKKDKTKNDRFITAMEQQAADRALVHSRPEAIELRIAHNDTEQWLWLVFDYDPGQKRMMAGAVEGSIVPHGRRGGFASMEDARNDGIAAIRKSGWNDLIVLNEQSP